MDWRAEELSRLGTDRGSPAQARWAGVKAEVLKRQWAEEVVCSVTASRPVWLHGAMLSLGGMLGGMLGGRI